VDHFGTIIRFTCNWPASASDQAIFDQSSFALNPWKFLKQNEEYIFVDLGFKRELFAVPPYKGKDGKLQHNALFNQAQRRGRVKVEHVNGVIKARFGSLCDLPIDIRGEADHNRCASWITACVILHNLLIQLRDDFDFEPEVDNVVDDDRQLHNDNVCVSAKVFQDAVRDRYLIQHGGYI